MTASVAEEGSACAPCARPKANGRQFAILLQRSATMRDCAERELVIAILARAWNDVSTDYPPCRDEAVAFFDSGDAGRLAETIGIDAQFLREIYARHHPGLIAGRQPDAWCCEAQCRRSAGS